MGTKTIRLDEDVYEMLSARKREDETFSEAVERLVGGRSFLELAEMLSDEEAAAFREGISSSHRDHDEEIEELLAEFE